MSQFDPPLSAGLTMNGYRDPRYDPSLPQVEVPMPPTDADIATKALEEEASYRFPSFSANDAVTLGLSLRKRFRSSSRHQRFGRGLVISIQTIVGHTLFSCTVGDLGSSVGDVSLDSWSTLEGMIAVVRRTGHSSFYVEKGMQAMQRTPRQFGINQQDYRIHGGAFPIWLQNATCCPIAVVACFSGSSADDHHMVVTSLRDYLRKLTETVPQPSVRMPSPAFHRDSSTAREWVSASAAGKLYRPSHFEDEHEHAHD
ncbi:hypothetical protein FA95DRAFT_1559228 [Auriscalpium vulgare]|uniref:Uncharacterized protein n=1 Tax=Auriscalpium vulgare TaxID=40419 RepID=A0ACB8RSW1_9AGAM|nr:hypothetical protein FA95DRAFT_1559228 [Auriscalpium vulgare]